MSDFSTSNVLTVRGNGNVNGVSPNLKDIPVPSLGGGKRSAVADPAVTNDSPKPSPGSVATPTASPESLATPVAAPAPAPAPATTALATPTASPESLGTTVVAPAPAPAATVLATPTASPESLATPVAAPVPAPNLTNIGEGRSPIGTALQAEIKMEVAKEVARVKQDVQQSFAPLPVAGSGQIPVSTAPLVGGNDGAKETMKEMVKPSATAPLPTLPGLPDLPPVKAQGKTDSHPVESINKGSGKEQIAALKGEVKELKQEAKELIASKGSKKESVKKEIDELKNEIKELRKEIARLKSGKGDDSSEGLVEVEDKKPAAKTASRSSEVEPSSGRLSQKVDPKSIFIGPDGKQWALKPEFLKDVEKFQQTNKLDYSKGDWDYQAKVSAAGLGGLSFLAAEMARGDTSIASPLGSTDMLHMSDKTGAKVALGTQPGATQVEFDSVNNRLYVLQPNGNNLAILPNEQGNWMAFSYNANGLTSPPQLLQGNTAIKIPTGSGNETGLLKLVIDDNNKLQHFDVGAGNNTYSGGMGAEGKFAYRPKAEELSPVSSAAFTLNPTGDLTQTRFNYDSYNPATRNPAQVMAGGTDPVAKYGQFNA
jgi:FlxA-like protein